MNKVKEFVCMDDLVKQVNQSLSPQDRVKIMCTDPEAWCEYPDFNQVYNKIWVAESQEIPCGPMGVYPHDEDYPVIFKPIINLYGMSRGVKKINNEEEYDANISDGLFWEKFLDGANNSHKCVDIVMKKGSICFVSALTSIANPNNDGSFDYHFTDPNYVLPLRVRKWIECMLGDYTGCVNIETITDKIIECHLRFNGDSQMYDYHFVKELISFLNPLNEKMVFQYNIPQIWLFPLFVPKDYVPKDGYIEEIQQLMMKYGTSVRSIMFDDVNSIHQSEHASRLLMFEIDDFDFGKDLLVNIKKYFSFNVI
jgi:hypothetical protein